MAAAGSETDRLQQVDFITREILYTERPGISFTVMSVG
jgi:hypothetical protein